MTTSMPKTNGELSQNLASAAAAAAETSENNNNNSAWKLPPWTSWATNNEKKNSKGGYNDDAAASSYQALEQQQQQEDAKQANKREETQPRSSSLMLRQLWQSPRAFFFSGSSNKRVIMVASASVSAVVLLSMTILAIASPAARHKVFGLPMQRVAFLGNSQLYFYDLPRLSAIMANQRIQQNSLLAGGGSLANLPQKQNGMWNRWRTDSAMLYTTRCHEIIEYDQDEQQQEQADDADSFVDDTVWDFGACTMTMLLTGHDTDQAQADYDEWWEYRDENNVQDDDAWAAGDNSNIANYPYLTNPCRQSQAYLDYLANLEADDVRVSNKPWDYVVLVDSTATVRYESSRSTAIAALEADYVPLLLESKATPLLLVTHSYWLNRNSNNNNNNNGEDDAEVDDNNDYDGYNNVDTFENVPFWTAQTYDGYRQYAMALKEQLPRRQAPRLVNTGIAFLTIYQERPDYWRDGLFWTDHKHVSPAGSFLQACLVHHAVYGHVPSRRHVMLYGNSQEDDSTSIEPLWDGTRTRTLMYPRDTVVDFPTRSEAEYLYDVCQRVAAGYIPSLMQQQMDELGLTWYN